MKEVLVNLLFVIKDGKILLAEKKRGFGTGLYNGCGGKVEEGETVEEAMVRETQEELGITPKYLEKVAVIVFNIIHKGERKDLVTHVFKTDDFEGEISESDEMRPMWFELDKIPYSKMWQDDIVWLPRVLNGEKLKAYFYFNDNGEIEKFHVEPLQTVIDSSNSK